MATPPCKISQRDNVILLEPDSLELITANGTIRSTMVPSAFNAFELYRSSGVYPFVIDSSGNVTSQTITCQNALTVSGTGSFGNLSCTGTTKLNSLSATTASVAGNLSCLSTIGVSGTGSFGSASITNGMTVGGNFYAKNNITLCEPNSIDSITANGTIRSMVPSAFNAFELYRSSGVYPFVIDSSGNTTTQNLTARGTTTGGAASFTPV